MKRVVICGYGSLGRRLAQHLVADGKYHLVLLDDYAGFHKGQRPSPLPDGEDGVKGTFEHVQANFLEMGEWVAALDGAYAVIQFAAINPYPECTWEEARLSMRVNSNVVLAAQRAGVRRLVLASSSHVLGGYMQDGAVVSAEAPEIGPSTKLGRFTHFRLPGFTTDASGYATAKVQLEEMGRAASTASAGPSVVAIRIGWCQPGENHPRQMTATATPTISAEKVAVQDSAEAEVSKGFDNRDLILAWLHRIWLSTRDFRQLFTRAIESEFKGYVVVSGVSNNSGMRWSKEGWEQLGYAPHDDAIEALGQACDGPDMSAPKRARCA